MTLEQNTPRGEHTQEKIIHAAYNLFNQNGYHGTSMRQIAQAADIAVASIYNHFPNKEQIFVAVLERYHPILGVLPHLAQLQAAHLADFVHQAAHFYADYLDRRQDFLNLFFIELVEFRASHVPHLSEKFLPLLTAFVQNLVANRSDLRPLPAFVLARAFLGMFFAYYLTRFLTRSAPNLWGESDDLDDFIDIFLHGILLKEDGS